MAEEKVGIKLEVDDSEGTKAVGNIRKEIKQATVALQEAQAQFGEYSAEAITAAKRVAELRDRVSEAAETAALFDPGQKFAAFSGALNAVAGGFSAVQGALGLVGVESEEVQKQLLKVQSALALSQGLNAITDSAKDFQRLGAVIKQTETFQRGLAAANVITSTALKAVGVSAVTTSTGFKVLRGAIIATGIGALAVGLVLLVQNFDKVRDAVYRFIPGLKSVTEFIGGLVQSVTDFIGITSEADRATAKLIADNSARIKAAERDLELNGDKYDQYTQRKIKANIDYRKSLEELTKDETLSIQERDKFIAQARAKADREIIRAGEDRNKAADDQRAAEQKKADDAAKQRADKRKAEADRLAGIEKQAQSELQRLRDEAAIAALRDEDQRQIKAIELAAQRETERIKALEVSEATRAELLKATIEKADREIQTINQARVEAEIKAEQDRATKLAELEADRLEDERKARQEAAQLKIEDTLRDIENERLPFDQRRALIDQGVADLQRYFEAGTIGEREYTQTLREYTQAREDIRAAEKASLENTVGAYAQVFGQISQLLGKNTAAGKAAAIAEATINTYLSASKAFQAMSSIPPAPVFGVIAAGVATAAGIKNIREIAKVPVPGGGGGGISTPSISAPSFSVPTSTAPIAPPRPQAAITQLDRQSMQGINVASTRAYVVESDITGAQERITRLNRAARIG